MTVASSLLLTLCLAFAEEPPACPLMQTLPPDGSWVKFDLKLDVDGREIRTVWTARSVGTTVHNGKPCRFVELEQTCEAPVLPVFGIVPIANQCWRALVPEAEFGENKDPLRHAAVVWMQNEMEQAVSTPSIAARDVLVDAILRGPSTDLKTEATPEKVSWQRGEVLCEVKSGSNETEFAGAKLRLDHRILRNKEVPFGVAGMRQKITASFGAMDFPASLRLDLRDYGEGAKAKLPELGP